MGVAMAGGRFRFRPIMPWHAIYCRSQFERVVEQGLLQAGIEPYYPCYAEDRRWSDRIKKIERPLFPGYVFARFEDGAETEAAIRQLRGAVAILGTPEGPTPIPDSDIAAIAALLASGLPLFPLTSPALEIGEAVVVKYGPLAGATGHILRLKGRLRLVITIAALNRSTTVEVDRAMLGLAA